MFPSSVVFGSTLPVFFLCPLVLLIWPAKLQIAGVDKAAISFRDFWRKGHQIGIVVLYVLLGVPATISLSVVVARQSIRLDLQSREIVYFPMLGEKTAYSISNYVGVKPCDDGLLRKNAFEYSSPLQIAFKSGEVPNIDECGTYNPKDISQLANQLKQMNAKRL